MAALLPALGPPKEMRRPGQGGASETKTNDKSKDNAPTTSAQWRARWLTRRFAISGAVAVVLADLAFAVGTPR